MFEITILTLSIVLTVYILVFAVDRMLNDSDQERLNEHYSRKAKQHNELMVKKESIPSSLKKESRDGS